MSHVNQKITAQFFLTANQPCPYLPDRQERKLFTTLRGPDARKMNDALSLRGFRRSQTVAYRPACANCGACLSVRVPVADFKPSRSQRRVLSRNADLDRRSCVAWATEEQFDLFRAYLSSRHTDGGMADMDICEFAAMVEETTVRTRVIEYHTAGNTGWGNLVAACLSDLMSDGISMVYSFFDPSEAARSLGRFMILDHIEIARAAGLPYVYLGYWVPGSAKMDYKSHFAPFEYFRAGQWRRLERAEDVPPEDIQTPDASPMLPE